MKTGTLIPKKSVSLPAKRIASCIMSRSLEDLQQLHIQPCEIQHNQHRRAPWQAYGEAGIYMITLCTEGRLPLLGQLVGNCEADRDSQDFPHVQLSELGCAIRDEELPKIHRFYPQVEVWQATIMPDHLHLLLRVTETLPRNRQIGDVISSFKGGCSRAWWRQHTAPAHSLPAPNGAGTAAMVPEPSGAGHITPLARSPLFESGYHDRIIKRPGMLETIKRYMADNPLRALIRRQKPDLFKIHRRTVVCELEFTTLGNHFLLDWPDRQLVEISRSVSEEVVKERLEKVMAAAHNGAVTYTAAISDGERLIARRVREAGCLLVVLLNDGFPAEDSPHERYFKPGGVYFEACSRGRLLMMEPVESAFVHPAVMAATEATLRRKAEARHFSYTRIPTESLRYRFVALNEMGRLMVER